MDINDWANCRGELFDYLRAFGRKEGEAVRHGDEVAIRYSYGKDDEGRWLSCAGKKGENCRTQISPGNTFYDSEKNKYWGEVFQIFSEKRRGRCSSNVSRKCIGDPIYPGDTVFIRYTKTGYWLSGREGKYIYTNTCPGTTPSNSKCQCERWTLYRR